MAIPGEALLQDHDPLELALPFTNEQRAGLQCDALPSLWGATVEGDAGAVLLLGAKVPPDRFVEIAESVRQESIGEHPHQEPAREMGRRFAAQMGAPLTAQSIEITALEIRHDRQNRDIARRGSPRCCRHRTRRYQPGLGFRAAHADHAARFALGLGSRRPPTSSVWTATRSPLSAGAPEIQYTDSPAPIRSRVTAYPRLRSPVIAARVVCASHPVAWVRSTMVAPSARRSRSIISASLLPSRGAAVGACRPASSRVTPFFASGRSRGCDASPGSIASCGPSSTAIAFNPAAVNLSVKLRPVSSRRQSGDRGFAWISRAKPSFTSLAPALLTAAPFIVSGAAKQRSSRCAAALIITSCASVSLTLMIQPFLSSRRPGRSEPLTGTSPGSAEAEGAVGSSAHHARRV